MALPGLTAFRASPTQVMSQGSLDTVALTVDPHGLSSTALAANAGSGAGGVAGPNNTANAGAVMSTMTAAAVPAPASGPVFVANAIPSQVIRLYNPTNGQLVYIGVDNTVNPTTGFAFVPGTRLDMMGYLGPIWALAANASSTLYYLTQALL